jgi:hypothetical protein
VAFSGGGHDPRLRVTLMINPDRSYDQKLSGKFSRCDADLSARKLAVYRFSMTRLWVARPK